MEALKAIIKEDVERSRRHREAFHDDTGTCWKGLSPEPCDPVVCYRVREMLEHPQASYRQFYFTLDDKEFMEKHLPPEARRDLRAAMTLPTEQRLALIAFIDEALREK